MQVFRLMGLPDKVIAFESLPKRLLSGFEMNRADGFPRHWKEWMGKTERIVTVPPEKDPLTGAVRRFDPIIETDHFFYLVDWNLKPVEEKWNEICDFVRQHVDKETRLKENLNDMALPLAPNKTDSVTLEPEDVVVIPIPIEYQEKDGEKSAPPVQALSVKCLEPGCTSSFEGQYARNALRMHAQRKHKAVAAV